MPCPTTLGTERGVGDAARLRVLPWTQDPVRANQTEALQTPNIAPQCYGKTRMPLKTNPNELHYKNSSSVSRRLRLTSDVP